MAAVSGAVLAGVLQTQPAAAAPAPTSTPAPTASPDRVTDPDGKLGKGWKSSADRAVTAAADVDGLRILVADSSKAYAWKTAAVLAEPSIPADSWIGNQCLMDHDHVAVVYAPRAFVNKPDLMQGGAFTAVVDLATGQVTKPAFTASLAYFDPSCNTTTHTAAFTAFRDMNDPALTRTRIVTVDTQGKTVGSTESKGEITSAVPVKDGTVAALGRRLVHLNALGTVKNLADADSTPFDIRPAADGKIAFVDRKGGSSLGAKVFTGHGKPVAIASGKLGDLDLMQGEAGRVFLTGTPSSTPATRGTGITHLDAPADTDVSSHGRLAVRPVLTPGIRSGLEHIKNAGKGFTTSEPSARAVPAPAAAAATEPLTVTSTATATGAQLEQSVPHSTAGKAGAKTSPVLQAVVRDKKPAPRNTTSPAKPSSIYGAALVPRLLAAPAAAAGAGNATDDDRWCAVSRNDVGAQALQPTPNQVEWAVDMAVRGELRSKWLRQGGYRDQAGLGTIDPQGLFPRPTLTGGGRIPANVLLGIMAQESNLWQAESGAIPGQMGNPLAAVDGYYGHKAEPGNPAAYWHINWEKSDCGYGVGQVTDGMRIAGREKVDASGNKEQLLSPALQKLVAIDYASNVAASLKILADKWNEVHADGQKITVNNDDPAMVENWFTAVWNYNLGFNPPSQAAANGGHWGLGWYNNPANPLYKKSWGHPFMNRDVDGADASRHAAHPQDWPYQSKVMGWAAWSIDTGFSYGTSGKQDWRGESGFSSAGFQPAWWLTNNDRKDVQPPLEAFCNSNNSCDAATPPNCTDEACYRQFWWTQPNVSWKAKCSDTCGHEKIKYETLINEPGRGTRLKNGTPVCTGAPAGAVVVASVPDGTPSWGDCGTIASAGSFQFAFNPGAQGRYEAKADLHQIGGGYGGHFWYTHERDAAHLGGDSGPMTIVGDWKAGKPIDGGQARVYAHIPDTGAQANAATYKIVTPFGQTVKTVDQGANANKWVDLGAYRFNEQPPEVTLSNSTAGGTADKDIAWGAVAFVPGDYTGMPNLSFADPDVSAPQPGDITEPADMTPLIPQGPLPSAPVMEAFSDPRSTYVYWCVGKPFGDLWKNKIWTNRYEACIKGQVRVIVSNGANVVGTAIFEAQAEIKLHQDDGGYNSVLKLRRVSATGAAQTAPLHLGVDAGCSVNCRKNGLPMESGSSTWEPGVDNHVYSTVQLVNWDQSRPQALLNHSWKITGQLGPMTGDMVAEIATGTEAEMRCDNALPNTNYAGCVFPHYKPTYVMNSKKFPAAAAHAWLVQEKLPGHYGSKKYDRPLTYLGSDVASVTNPSKKQSQTNRDVICPTSFQKNQDATLSPELDEPADHSYPDTQSCDEFAFAASYDSGGMPVSAGGFNPVSSGDECLQTYAKKGGDGVWHLYNDPRYPLPSWNEKCGRASISNNQNTQSMRPFGQFITRNRLLDRDQYWLDLNGFTG
ncbi:Tat pathway signal protein [Streptomyces melanogenes]|uniref:golvesin C-terminal-like domain-containing protein n=1 Tax=Streptomyces melanogenes TaxID=67326 RepID=UPI0037BA17AE